MHLPVLSTNNRRGVHIRQNNVRFPFATNSPIYVTRNSERYCYNYFVFFPKLLVKVMQQYSLSSSHIKSSLELDNPVSWQERSRFTFKGYFNIAAILFVLGDIESNYVSSFQTHILSIGIFYIGWSKLCNKWIQSLKLYSKNMRVLYFKYI